MSSSTGCRVRAARACAGLVVALSLCSCGSGGEVASPPARVIFASDGTRTVFAAGAVRFSITPPLAAGEQAVCLLAAGPGGSCTVDSQTGELRYEGLQPGSHTLTLELRSGGAATAAAGHTVQVVRPAVVVFGATPGGISAAIAAARAGQTVALLEPTQWVGGMMSGGLAKTDIGTRGAEVLGGLATEFFERLRTSLIQSGTCSDALPCAGPYDFEPRLAERLFERMLAEAPLVVVERSAQLVGVSKEGARILRIATSRGEVSGEVFVDASYEGDLVARAGVPYRLGREERVLGAGPSDVAGLAAQEDHAGLQRFKLPLGGLRVDPYRTPGVRSSGTLPFIEPGDDASLPEGSADRRVMAYTFRLCVTDDPSNRRPFTRPDNFDAVRYEASARVAQTWAATGVDLSRTMFNPARTVRSVDRAYFKHDLNGGSTFSIDMTADEMNQAYVEADETQRARIRQAYRNYIEGLLYTWQTDPRFGPLNAKVARFGWCADEFVDRGGWPHQLYVRTARRMVGEYVMNENDLMQNGRRPPISDVVGFGSYDMDMHTHRYHVAPVLWPGELQRRDALVTEGFLIVHLPEDRPYPVSYRALVPTAQHATNLLSPVPLSATYVAYSSLRMEPTFMMLGQAAGIAAALAVEQGASVQAVSYSVLRDRLLAVGHKLTR